MRFMPDTTIIRGESELHWRSTRIQFALRLPMRLWVVILISAACLLALTIPITLSKSPEASSDVFADYVDFFPGQYWSAALESAFRCNVDVATEVKYCFLSPQDSLFLDVGLTIENDQIMYTTFSLRQNALKAGDLAVLWGKPEVQISGYIAYVDWHNLKIKAIARTDNERFDYFLSVSNVAFY